MSTLFEKIAKKGEEVANKITLETKEEVKKLFDNAEKEILLNKEETLNKTKLKIEREITQKKSSFTLEKRQAILKHKMNLIEEVINKLYEEINTLKGEELLKFSLLLLKKENLSGKHIMRVNKIDYSRYLDAFSTNKKSDKVLLDKLNKELKNSAEIYLENEDANILDGFLIVGDDFDLNFSISNFVNNLKSKYEKEIFNILFEE